MLRISKTIQLLTLAAIVLLAFGAQSYSQAPAPCDIRIEFVTGGLIIGASGGSGTLTCQGKRYPLTIGGVKLGAVIGVSKSELYGQAFNVNSPGDVAGTYGAAEAGYAVVSGKRAAKLKNTKGVVLQLRGRQVGLEFSLDLSGLELGLK
jgi:hypothetical protein